MTDIKIRQVELADLEALQEISKITFAEAFAAENSAENMQHYLAEKFSVAQLSTELAEDNSEFYFALVGEKPVGYLKINADAAQTEDFGPNALEIERIYVLKESYGSGVAQILLEKAFQRATQLAKTEIWLGVWEKNLRAINFYRKNGFEAFSEHAFELGDDVQTDILMKRHV